MEPQEVIKNQTHVATFKRQKQMREYSPILAKKLSSNKSKGITFSIKFSKHFGERMLDRNINFEEVKELLESIVLDPVKADEIKDFILSDDREARLELTDGELWLGIVIDPSITGDHYILSMRMAIKNKNRFEGRIKTKVIKK